MNNLTPLMGGSDGIVWKQPDLGLFQILQVNRELLSQSVEPSQSPSAEAEIDSQDPKSKEPTMRLKYRPDAKIRKCTKKGNTEKNDRSDGNL